MLYEPEFNKINLQFLPYNSLLYKIENGEIKKPDIYFKPKTPEVIERPAGFM